MGKIKTSVFTDEEIWRKIGSLAALTGKKRGEVLTEALEEYMENHSQNNLHTHKKQAQTYIKNQTLKQLNRLIQHLEQKRYHRISQIDLEHQITELGIGACERTYQKYIDLLLYYELVYPLQEIVHITEYEKMRINNPETFEKVVEKKHRKPKFLFVIHQDRLHEFPELSNADKKVLEVTP